MILWTRCVPRAARCCAVALLLVALACPKDPPQTNKLDSLEEAHRAGVLTDEEYQAKKAALLSQDEAPEPADEAPKVPGPKVSRGQIYRHPVGFTFWYPADWKVTEVMDSLQLVPPDPKSNADGPLEAYFFIGDSADGVKRPDDPRVIQYLSQQLRAAAPFLSRSGDIEAITTASGAGAVVTFAGSNPKGITILTQAYVTILKGMGIALVAMGERTQIEKRRSQIRRVFETFGLERGTQDPELAGTWRLVSTSAISNTSPFETAWSRAQAVSEETSTLTLRADGSWSRTDRRHMLVGAAGIWLEDKSSSTAKGSWSAAAGRLYLIWSDKSWEDYRYELRGPELRLASDTSGEVWRRVR